MHRRFSSSRWLRSPLHLFGLVVAALVVAVPMARAEETRSAEVEQRVHVLEGRVKELESQVRGPGTKESGLIPGVLIGPRLSLLSLPTPTLGAEAKILRYLGVSFDYGFLPKITVSDLTVKYDMWNVAARVYPWGKTFFVGAVWGHYGVSGAAANGTGSGEAHVSSTFIGPQIGGRWIQPSGFFTAVDLAWGFPLSFSSEATEGASGKTLEFKQNAEKYLQHGVPLIGLVSFGYLF
ncbi:MAG TPA: hypothetical protein VFN91_01900 [Myxococcaceae bacterium]|nr:hypothetical protein [Myxococcaceae bacterium]